MLVTSLAKCLRRYRANKKTKILAVTVLEVEIGMKVTTSGRHRNFSVAKFDLGGGDMKVATTNIRSVNPHTPEHLRPATDVDGGGRADAATKTNTGDTNTTYPALIQVFEVPAQKPLNDEALRVVVAQSISKTPGRPLSTFTESGGSVVGVIIAHVMDASNVEMPEPPHFLNLFHYLYFFHFLYLLFHCHSYRLHIIHFPNRNYPKVIPTTRSHSTGNKSDCNGRKWFEDCYGVKKNLFYSSIPPIVPEEYH